ncbi:helix-turn-helix domain-containing protein [Mucilaginibacter sp. RS28]|uniref:Helix-turn-helix domain-containing protein n=2 Tax=Mucilaginibacter straminoryzae TaxID=2932774 RepID=A0A9X1X1H6_9SPHI|nr:helix-turn-helix domain-containing protein [Mucilaginibacter straminoryzae]MCJ8208285.1 helix-turn-helix domain-containing protein [Mucilaginibacter straminoryzae]
MKHVTILIPQGTTSLSNIEGTYQIFNEVNSFMAMMGKPPLFEIHLAGGSAEASQRNGLFTIKPHLNVKDIAKTDLVIIPAVHGDQQKVIESNAELLPWIVEQYKGGAELACFCLGAFFLAATGLLKGKQCATHWHLAHQFRAMYPDVNLVDDKIMTEDDGIYSSGGAYSYLNLVVYLIEKYAGRDVAVLTAKTFMIDIDRSSQSPFMIFQGQKMHEDEQIKKAQEYIEHNFAAKITVDGLADMLALGRRNLERRFKKATSNTVVEYIQRVKIEAAKKGFETSRKNINEVMYEVGYTDTKAFRTIFRKVTGLSPIAYRNKYNKEAVMHQAS